MMARRVSCGNRMGVGPNVDNDRMGLVGESDLVMLYDAVETQDVGTMPLLSGNVGPILDTFVVLAGFRRFEDDEHCLEKSRQTKQSRSCWGRENGGPGMPRTIASGGRSWICEGLGY
jgi:hypothetical protein